MSICHIVGVGLSKLGCKLLQDQAEVQSLEAEVCPLGYPTCGAVASVPVSDMSLPFEAGLKIKLRARILALSLPIWAGSEV